ncbi:SPX domain-containing protein 3 [Cucurbita moschata]|uniref:SPX domain-containing protein 3 n=1 Tax=Cucurbita moschata TaxID=3662 RepID=A0A6J1H6Y6_CUCMO|nr:SPX domain-containing protein 3 [Cucurbita moschata]
MKFGKRLKQQIEDTLPDWRDKFLLYKDLKKLVRVISRSTDANADTDAEVEFVCLLNSEIDKFNSFFMEQEEDFVIRHRELRERIDRVLKCWGRDGSGREYHNVVEIGNIREDIVNLHGEMVLLVNYSNVNYIGLGKILKKYDKRTGGLLRVSFIAKILEQPFYKTDSISKMIKECESSIDAIFPVRREAEEDMKKGKAISAGGEGILRNTVSALLSMEQIRRGSSTYSHFSLPPLNLSHSDFIHSFQLNSPIPILHLL